MRAARETAFIIILGIDRATIVIDECVVDSSFGKGLLAVLGWPIGAIFHEPRTAHARALVVANMITILASFHNSLVDVVGYHISFTLAVFYNSPFIFSFGVDGVLRNHMGVYHTSEAALGESVVAVRGTIFPLVRAANDEVLMMDRGTAILGGLRIFSLVWEDELIRVRIVADMCIIFVTLMMF